MLLSSSAQHSTLPHAEVAPHVATHFSCGATHATHFSTWQAHLDLLKTLSPDVMAALTINGLVGTVLSDLLWAQAVLLTSPLAVNLSTCLTIPLAFLVDHVKPCSCERARTCA